MKLSTFGYRKDDVTCPGLGSATVVPSNSTNFTDAAGNAAVARELVVFADGTVTFVGVDGVADTWTFTTDMSYPVSIPVACIRVNSTGTSVASGNIKAIW